MIVPFADRPASNDASRQRFSACAFRMVFFRLVSQLSKKESNISPQVKNLSKTEPNLPATLYSHIMTTRRIPPSITGRKIFVQSKITVASRYTHVDPLEPRSLGDGSLLPSLPPFLAQVAWLEVQWVDVPEGMYARPIRMVVQHVRVNQQERQEPYRDQEVLA